jgi:hypothetical protein
MKFMKPTAKYSWIGHKKEVKTRAYYKNYKQKPYWTTFQNIKPTGFNMATEYEETDFRNY